MGYKSERGLSVPSLRLNLAQTYDSFSGKANFVYVRGKGLNEDMLNEHHITVTKTARYYSRGALNGNTERIWIVVHGYLQRAEDFIKMFDFLDDGKTYIVAPEALNRGYLKGGYDKTGATWMTKDDRENEIKDYVAYLNQLFQKVEAEKPDQTTISVLGFSQGATTVSRWLNNNMLDVEELVLYAGELGAEMLAKPQDIKFSAKTKTFVYGTTDQYITAEKVDAVSALFTTTGFAIRKFEGGHEIKKEAFENL
jgi:predicted esterase